MLFRSQTLLARLALVDVVCARAADFGVADDPLMLLVVADTVHRCGWRKRPEPPLETMRQFIRDMIAPAPAASQAALAATARKRYLEHAPRGSRWGTTGVCGAHYDEGPQEMVDCGMAFAPARSRRFLDFYVKAT